MYWAIEEVATRAQIRYLVSPLSNILIFYNASILGRLYAKARHWPSIISIKDGKYDLNLPRDYATIFLSEKRLWPLWYGSDFTNKVILDVGAGAGETASYFFNHGAKEIITIEPDALALKYLQKNAEQNHWPLKIIPRHFRARDLEIPYDFLKMDIEGGEVELFNASRVGPCRMELHPRITGKEASLNLIQKFSLKPIFKDKIYGVIE